LVCVIASVGFVLVLGGILVFGFRTADNDQSLPTFMAAIATDGDRVYYDGAVETTRCIISDSLKNWGKEARLVVRNGANPVLSRDGGWLFFEREGDAGREVWRHEIASDHEERVFAGSFSASIHDVNSNGSRVIAGVKNVGIGGYSVKYYLVDADSTDDGALLGDDACFVRGDCVVYRKAGLDGLWLREKDGPTRKIVSQGYLPRSSHDGVRILYVSDIKRKYNERRWKVYEFGSERNLSVAPAPNAVLSQDGATVLFTIEPWPTPMMGRLSLEPRSTKNLGRMPGYLADWRSSAGGMSAVACAGMSIPSALLIYDPKADVIRQFPIAPFVPAPTPAPPKEQPRPENQNTNLH
jgi:hypothetical protein